MFIKKVIALVPLLMLAAPLFALEGKIEGKEIEGVQYAMDTLWVILAAVLVFFMQAGFAMVESGFTRSKNAVNIMMKNMMDLSIGVISFWLIGFGIMFGVGNAFMGTSGFLVDASKVESYASLAWSSVPVYAAFFFQSVFAATAATIVSGAVAERAKFSAYLVISVLLTTIIYPISGHWGWGGGFLGDFGFTDFAGSTLVHSVGGWAALAAVIVLGPRKGKYTADGKARAIPGHNIPLATLGVLILWMGWFGFNAGSTMAADTSIGLIALTTVLSAAAASLTAFSLTFLKFKRADVGMTLNGALAGLVGITAGCANLTPTGALITGVVSGAVVLMSVEIFEKLRIDDPVGAISVHGVVGAVGTLMVGLLDGENGLLYGGSFELMKGQLIGVVSVGVWAFGVSFLLFKIVDKVIGLRVPEEVELEGLDFHEHGANAYHDFQISSIKSM